MSERYTRLYAFPENLYLEGAPVLIVAGALLKDNETKRVLAQIKMRNLCHSALTACKVQVRAFDPSGEECRGVDGYSYLDIQVSCGKEFGAQEPIYLPDNTTRSVLVSVIQAVFEDGTVWQHPAAEWRQPPFRWQRFKERFPDREMRAQYVIEVGGSPEYFPEYVPETADGLFLCACGMIDLGSEGSCPRCHREKGAMVAALDDSMLEAKMEERLAREEAERIERKRLEEERERQAEEERIIARKKKRKKMILGCGIAVLAVAILARVKLVIIPESKYRAAEELLEEKRYDEAAAAFGELGGYRDAASRKQDMPYIRAEDLLEEGDAVHAAIAFYKMGDYKDARVRSMELWKEICGRKMIAAGGSHTVGLRADGTVLAVGDNSYGECNTRSWKDIVAVAAGIYHTVGLRADGTVLAVGNHECAQCDTGNWTDIMAVAAGTVHTVGLRADGTVLAVGDNYYGQCEVENWTDIVAVAAGTGHTVGVRKDGTVLAVGDNSYKQCATKGWKNIVAVAAGAYHTVWLRADGTVVVRGDNLAGQCNTESWKDIVAVAAGYGHTVGLRADGTVQAVGYNDCGQCRVGKWKDIMLPSTAQDSR